jgi:hypothetical protein
MSEIEDTMHDLESAFAELKSEFKKLDNDSDEDEMSDDEDMNDEDMSDDHMDDDEDMNDDDMDKDDIEESEDWADLEESLDLDVITSNLYGPGSKSSTESGSGGKSVNVNTKSPVPMSQKERFGAKPVDPDKGPVASGYSWHPQKGYIRTDSAPLSGMSDNRRKKSTDGMEGLASTTSYGKTKQFNSKLEMDGDFPYDKNSKGPLSTAPKK